MTTASQAQLDFLAWFAAHMRDGGKLPNQKALRGAMGRHSMAFSDARGHTPMAALLQPERGIEHMTREREIFKALLERGGNPLLHGNPLRGALPHATRGGGYARVMIQCEEADAALAARGEDNGNLMHDWMELNPRAVASCLFSHIKSPTVTGYLTQRRLVDGYTPVHCLWAGLAQRVPAGAKRASDPYEDDPTQAMVVSGMLLEQGIDMTIPDACGQSAAQMAVDFFSRHKVPVYHRKTYNQLRKLAAVTPVDDSMRATTRPRMRL